MLIYTEWDTNDDSVHKFYNAYAKETDYGTCCFIVPYLDFVNPDTKDLDPEKYTRDLFHNVPKGARHGILHGLKLLLDVEEYEYAYYTRGAKGFRLAMTDARDQPLVEQDGYYIASGTETTAAITPKMLNITENALSRFDPEDRDCYLDEEFYFLNLSWTSGYRYSMMNCLYQAVIDEIATNCSCRPSFSDDSGNLDFCRGTGLLCALDWMKSVGNEPFYNAKGEKDLTYARTNDSRKLKCRQRCKVQIDTVMFSSSVYPSEQTFPLRKDYCYTLRKVARVCANPWRQQVFIISGGFESFDITCYEILAINNSSLVCNDDDKVNTTMALALKPLTEFLFDYARRNFAVLKIYFKDPYFTVLEKDEAITRTTFIANAGGLMGLCLGLSFVSVFEVLYHCLNFCVTKIGQKVDNIPQVEKVRVENTEEEANIEVENRKTETTMRYVRLGDAEQT